MSPADVLSAVQLAGATKLETLLAQAFVRKYPDRFDEYQFNYRLGAGVDPGANYTDNIRRMNVLLTQKRVDMVSQKGNHFALWELKARAGFNALGQLLGYSAMWQAAGMNGGAPELGIITRLVDADVDLALKKHGISVELFDSDAIRAAATLTPQG